MRATRLTEDAERWDVAPASTSYRDAMRPSWKEINKRPRPRVAASSNPHQPAPPPEAKKAPMPVAKPPQLTKEQRVTANTRRDQAVAEAVRRLKVEGGEENAKKLSPELRARILTTRDEISAQPLSEFIE